MSELDKGVLLAMAITFVIVTSNKLWLIQRRVDEILRRMRGDE